MLEYVFKDFKNSKPFCATLIGQRWIFTNLWQYYYLVKFQFSKLDEGPTMVQTSSDKLELSQLMSNITLIAISCTITPFRVLKCHLLLYNIWILTSKGRIGCLSTIDYK